MASFRISEKELEFIKQKAHERKMSFSDFVRNAALAKRETYRGALLRYLNNIWLDVQRMRDAGLIAPREMQNLQSRLAELSVAIEVANPDLLKVVVNDRKAD